MPRPSAADRETMYLRTIIRKALKGSNVAIANKLGAASIECIAMIAGHAIYTELAATAEAVIATSAPREPA
jgi:hypothetical protein